MQYMIYEIITKTIKHSTLLQNHPYLVNISKNLLSFQKTYIVNVDIQEVHEKLG